MLNVLPLFHLGQKHRWAHNFQTRLGLRWPLPDLCSALAGEDHSLRSLQIYNDRDLLFIFIIRVNRGSFVGTFAYNFSPAALKSLRPFNNFCGTIHLHGSAFTN